MRSKNIIAQIVSAAIIAIGLTIVWAIVGNWGSRLTRDLLGKEAKSREHLMVALDGTPLIVTSVGGSDAHRTYRKLDGTQVERLSRQSLYIPELQAAPWTPGLISNPVLWSYRLGNTSDLANPPVYWHLVRDDRQQGHAYFVGYNSVSKHRVGFIGREGFRASLPPEEQWFNLGDYRLGYNRAVYASGVGMEAARSYNNWEYFRESDSKYPPDWVGFLIDGDQIVQIDFRRRTVSTFTEASGASAIAFGREPKELISTDQVIKEVGVSPTPDANENEESDDEYRAKTVSRLFVRYPDRVVVWDLKNTTSKEFLLPASLHHTTIQPYSIGKEQLLVQYHDGYWEGGGRYQLIWIDAAGEELRQETAEILSYRPPSARRRARDDAWAAPVPIFWVARLFGIRPFHMLQNHEASTYLAAVATSWQASWRAIAVLTLLAAIAVVISWRWHRRYARPNAWWWSTFVFLFSVPGLVAYRFFQGHPPLEACAECGETVPRDRDGCARCEKPFAEPALLGTEILA